MRKVNNLILPVLCCLALLSACGSDPAANHESALPHNLDQSGALTEQEADQLAHAEGRNASMASPESLLDLVRKDSSPLVVVHFWKLDCPNCLRVQQALQNIQQQHSEAKLQVFTVNLDAEEAHEKVNLHIRSSGLTARAFQLTAHDNGWFKELEDDWTGNLPALFLKTNDGYEQFFSKILSENELNAILQPFLL